MDKKKRSGILLAVGVAVLAVLVIAAVFLFRQDGDTEKESSAIKISQISSSEVTAMRITEENGHVVEVEKREDGW